MTFIIIDSWYSLAFSCTPSLYVTVLSSEYFYRSKIEVFLIPNTCKGHEGNMYLGIEDLNDEHAYYLFSSYRDNKNLSLKRTDDNRVYRYGIYLNRPVTWEELVDYFKTISRESYSIEVKFSSTSRSDLLELYNTDPNFSLSTGRYNWVNIVPNNSNLDNIKIRGHLGLISFPDNIVKDKHKD
jgi:hypothetical protein